MRGLLERLCGAGLVASLLVGASGCGGGSASPPPDMGPLLCNLKLEVSPATDPAHPLVPGTTVRLSLSDRGAPEARGGTVVWSVSGGALEAAAGHTTGWKLPTDKADYDTRKLTVSAKTSGMVNCPPTTLSTEVVLSWPEPLRTVVLHNPMQDGSTDVARYYAAFRGIPDSHLCAVPYADPVTVAASDFVAFSDAVTACVSSVGTWVAYVVPVYGVPYKVAGRITDTFKSMAKVTTSLDALLAFGSVATRQNKPLWTGPGSPSSNPVYLGNFDRDTGMYPDPIPWGSLRTIAGRDVFLVARIDGADADAAKALVDRTRMAEALAASGKLAGTVYVDGAGGLPHPVAPQPGSAQYGEASIAGVEAVFKALGTLPLVTDYGAAEFGKDGAPLKCPDALYYAGWSAFDVGGYSDAFTWRPGAVGGHLDACSACDIRGSKDWSAMALRRGITATLGPVNPPSLLGMPDYDLFFSLLLSGASFGEAGYEASRTAAWMLVLVGDPLYRPYPKTN